MNLFGNTILIPRSVRTPRCILYIALGPLMRSNCTHHIPCKVHSHLLCRTTAKTVVVVEHRPLIRDILFGVQSCPVVSYPCMYHHCLPSTNNNLHSRIHIPFYLGPPVLQHNLYIRSSHRRPAYPCLLIGVLRNKYCLFRQDPKSRHLGNNLWFEGATCNPFYTRHTHRANECLGQQLHRLILVRKFVLNCPKHIRHRVIEHLLRT